MKPNFRLNILNIVIVSVLLLWLTGEAVAQSPGSLPPGKPPEINIDSFTSQGGQVALPALGPQLQIGTAFTYQGQLKRGATPVTGNCSMDFRLYDQSSGGNLMGGPIVSTVPVNNSLFTVQLDFGAAFTGDARWLGIQVQCPGDGGYTDLGRQLITAAPYALSLRPGAVISGSINNGPVLQLYNTDASTSGGYAISAINYSGNTWRPAIYGENKGASAGVFGSSSGGNAVVGWSQSNTSSGVYGYNAGSGYGGWFDSASDQGDLVLGGAMGRINTDPGNENSNLILSSNNDVTVRLDNDGGENGVFRIVSSGGSDVFTADEQSNLAQLRTGNGLVKAAVYADCNKHSPSIVRSFSSVGSTITITNTVDDGTCIIDFGFRVDDRFFTATATDVDYEIGHTPLNVRGVTCGFTVNSNQLVCYRWNGNMGDLVNGVIMVVIY
jgi:hypothetical protein